MKQASADLPFSVTPIPSESILRETASFSVDCDTPAHYAYAFAPPEHSADLKDVLWLEMLHSIADIFDHWDIKATFFCIANQLTHSKVRDTFKALLRKGHEIGNHTWSHPCMHQLNEAQRADEIIKGHETIATRLGSTPTGYRAPAYYSTPEDLSLLAEIGYTYDASAYTSRLTRLAYRIFTARFERQSTPELPKFHFQYPANTPSLMTFPNGKRMVEWPLPTPLGLGFLGTLHTISPQFLFFSQRAWIRGMNRHTHYALHLIEAPSPRVACKWPWLPTIAKKYHLGQRSPKDWLRKRVGRMLEGRQAATLSRLTAQLLEIKE